MKLINIISQMAGGYDNTAPPPVTPDIVNPLFLFYGESNAEGLASDLDATAPELASTDALRLLNPANLLIEDMDIGFNNYRGEGQEEPTFRHGWELQLANRVRENTFSVSQVHLVKSGFGGKTVAQLSNPSDCWTALTTRMNAALAIDPTLNPILFYSQGINDSIAGTNIATWKASTVALFAAIRALYGADMPIIWPKLMTGYSTFNTAIDEVAASIENCWTVETTDLSLEDSFHWDYAGMKTMADRMIDKLLENYTI